MGSINLHLLIIHSRMVIEAECRYTDILTIEAQSSHSNQRTIFMRERYVHHQLKMLQGENKGQVYYTALSFGMLRLYLHLTSYLLLLRSLTSQCSFSSSSKCIITPLIVLVSDWRWLSILESL